MTNTQVVMSSAPKYYKQYGVTAVSHFVTFGHGRRQRDTYSTRRGNISTSPSYMTADLIRCRVSKSSAHISLAYFGANCLSLAPYDMAFRLD